MNFTDTFIRRPVFATVLSLLLLLVGAVSYFKLPVRQFPEIDATVITVTTTYPGASADLMEGFVTTPLENAIGVVNGIDYMKSTSSPSSSSIRVHFKLGYDINEAMTDVTSAVSSARYLLPKDINDPIIQKMDPNARPIMYISFNDPDMSPQALTDYLTRIVQPQLSTIDGVGQAKILGARMYAMRIWMNPSQMAAHNVTPNDVATALQTNNLQTPAGQIKTTLNEFSVNAETSLLSAEQFNNLVVKAEQPRFIRIGDIGQAELGAQNTDFSAFMNGKESTTIGIIPKSTGNPLAISQEATKKLAEMKKAMPPGMDARIMWDTSKFIAESIKEVKRTILEASIIVIAIIFLFLGSFRTLLIPAVTIPLSLIGVFSLMAAMGFTINTLTLLSLVLAIGMVVDDAIVVSENIHRHIELGKGPIAAAIIGAREIQFAVIAMTLTLAAVFAPIGFMSGLTGALFREFAFTLAAAVIISGFIALTLSPMMCSKFLRPTTRGNVLERAINRTTTLLASGYKKFLGGVLNWRFVVIIIIVGIFTSIYFLYKTTPSELAPKEDIGALMVIASGPANANLQYTQKYTHEIADILKQVPEGQRYGVLNGIPSGVNSALAFLVLKPWDERKRNVDQIIVSLFPKLHGITGLRAFPVNPFRLPGSDDVMPINFILETTGSYEELDQVMQKLLAAARANKNLTNVDTDFKYDKTDIDINIDRNKAADLGIPISQIGNLLSVSLGQPVISYFSISGRSYDVIPQLAHRYQSWPDAINNLNIKTSSGKLVPLSNLVSIKEATAPRSLNHFQQLRAADLTGSVMPGYTLGQALTYLENAAKKIMPANMKYSFSGASRQFVEASHAMMYTFIFALLFIFLVLAAQFESFRDPLVVMFSVPLSTLGALIGIKLIGGTMNIYTEIGIVTLIGLISKHGILIVEFANQLQAKGRNVKEAVIEAASIRLRPVLMTTFSMILGVLPLALATGAGAVSRQQMGWTIIGGMAIGTIFTLLIVPTMYTFLGTVKKVFTTGDEAIDKTL